MATKTARPRRSTTSRRKTASSRARRPRACLPPDRPRSAAKRRANRLTAAELVRLNAVAIQIQKSLSRKRNQRDHKGHRETIALTTQLLDRIQCGTLTRRLAIGTLVALQPHAPDLAAISRIRAAIHAL